MIDPVQSRCHEGSPVVKRSLRWNWEGFVEKVGFDAYEPRITIVNASTIFVTSRNVIGQRAAQQLQLEHGLLSEYSRARVSSLHRSSVHPPSNMSACQMQRRQSAA